MSKSLSTPFSAPDPTLGYLYQIRCALLWSLQRLKIQPEFMVSIETLDDVAFEDSNCTPSELLQAKHHRRTTASLTDHSPDLWKTLRIWFEGTAKGTILPNTSLVLVTTAVASTGSAANRLKKENRDVQKAMQALDAVATSSTNQTNTAAYGVYLSTAPAARKKLLEQVVIIDGAPVISDLDTDLKNEVFWAAGKKDHEAFLQRLEGWWFRRVVQQLSASSGSRIASVEIEEQMGDLREQFKQEGLPIDDDLLEFKLDDETQAVHLNSMFVRQLDVIKAGKRRVAAAIRDYYRAFEQRSRWLRQDLVVDLELSKYEKRLVEEWEVVFEAMRDELGDDAVDAAKESAARKVLIWAERTPFPIRANVTEPFICRGSFHMLADDGRIGWHPEFRDRLAEVLSSAGA